MINYQGEEHEKRQKGKKVIIILGILLAVLAVVIGRFMIKPNPQKLAQEILDNLKTVESFNAERTFSIRILGDYELNGVQYSKTEGSESVLRIFSRMKVTNNPYHLETEGTVKQTALLNYGATTADEIETDFQVISDEKDGMNHVNYGNETKDFEYSYCPTLNPELFEGIANGSIEAKYGESDDGLKAALNWLYLDVNVSGEALKNFFLDEEKQLFGYDLDKAPGTIEWE